MKIVQCNFQVQTTPTAHYCFIFYIFDDRCFKNTIWKPPHANTMLCTWVKRKFKSEIKHITKKLKLIKEIMIPFIRIIRILPSSISEKIFWILYRTINLQKLFIFINKLHVLQIMFVGCVNASLYHESEMIKSDKLLTANLHLLLPIIIIVLIVSGIIGTLCFWHLCIRKKKVTLYVNPQHDDFLNSACFESTDLSIVDNNDSEKEIDHDNLSSDDIVLLYTKNSISFMALMKDFRETLAKMCSCSVSFRLRRLIVDNTFYMIFITYVNQNFYLKKYLD